MFLLDTILIEDTIGLVVVVCGREMDLSRDDKPTEKLVFGVFRVGSIVVPSIWQKVSLAFIYGFGAYL